MDDTGASPIQAMDDTNTELYRDFPLEIREAYKEIVEVVEPFRRHNQILRSSPSRNALAEPWSEQPQD